MNIASNEIRYAQFNVNFNGFLLSAFSWGNEYVMREKEKSKSPSVTNCITVFPPSYLSILPEVTLSIKFQMQEKSVNRKTFNEVFYKCLFVHHRIYVKCTHTHIKLCKLIFFAIPKN